MDFDDMKAKADAEAGKLEQEGEQKAKQEFDKEAPQYEQKAKTDAEDYAKEILARKEVEHPVGRLYQGGAFTHVEAVPNPAPLPKKRRQAR